MPNTFMSLFDPGALGVVVTGTALACAARCGWRDFGAALRQADCLLRRGFNPETNRKALALALTEIQRDGSHRANPALPPDRSLGLMLDAYLRHGTLESLHTARRTQRAIVAAQQTNAAQVFAWAGELAPVFGLIGTLYAFTQLAPIVGGDTVRLTMQAISTAVLSTLYGALLAHLLCFPLATAITRRAARNESAREALAEWFIDQIAKAATLAQVRRAQLRGVA